MYNLQHSRMGVYIDNSNRNKREDVALQLAVATMTSRTKRLNFPEMGNETMQKTAINLSTPVLEPRASTNNFVTTKQDSKTGRHKDTNSRVTTKHQGGPNNCKHFHYNEAVQQFQHMECTRQVTSKKGLHDSANHLNF